MHVLTRTFSLHNLRLCYPHSWFQDVSEQSCNKYPRLYIPGQTNQLFNKKIFFLSLLYGTLTSIAIFFLPYGTFHDAVASDGRETSSVPFFGTVIAAILVVVVNVEVKSKMNSRRKGSCEDISLLSRQFWLFECNSRAKAGSGFKMETKGMERRAGALAF